VLFTLDQAERLFTSYFSSKIDKNIIGPTQELETLFPHAFQASTAIPEEIGEEFGIKRHIDRRIPLKIIMEMFEKDLLPYHRVINKKTNTEYEEQGKFRGIEIVTEKSHNKFLTKIIGLEAFGFDLKKIRALRDVCKVKYACSISLKEIPGSAKRK